MLNKILYIIILCIACNSALAKSHNQIAQAEKYLNSLQNVSAVFIQESNNNQQFGTFTLSNSHDVRWEYKKPRNIVITFCNNKLVYHDKDLNNKETYSIDNPFIEFIATRPINLSAKTNFFIREVKDKTTEFQLVISNVKKSVGSFILIFNKDPVQLKTLVLFDDFGAPIEIAFNKMINYTHLLTNPLFYCDA